MREKLVPKIKLSEQASLDLDEILFRSAVEFGIPAAARYRDKIAERLKLLAAFPEASSSVPEFSGVRSTVVQSHKLFYRIETDHILILRILHTRQLPPGLD